MSDIREARVHVVGCGAIGSFTALALAKLGVGHLKLTDPDVVGIENVGPQLYDEGDIGEPKVIALERRLASFGTIHTNWERGEDSPLNWPITITALDSLEARRAVFLKWLLSLERRLLIDARMGFETFEMFECLSTDGASLVSYVGTLRGIGTEEPCSARSIVYCPQVAGGLLAAEVKRWVGGCACLRTVVFHIPTVKGMLFETPMQEDGMKQTELSLMNVGDLA